MSIWSQFNLLRTNGLGATGLETPDAGLTISNRIFDLYVKYNIQFYTGTQFCVEDWYAGL